MLILKFLGTLPPSQPTTGPPAPSASYPRKGHRPDRQGTARESGQFRERYRHVDSMLFRKSGELPGHPGVAILTAKSASISQVRTGRCPLAMPNLRKA